MNKDMSNITLAYHSVVLIADISFIFFVQTCAMPVRGECGKWRGEGGGLPEYPRGLAAAWPDMAVQLH